jgi:hypothetical protein
MRKSLALFSVVITAAVSLAFSVETAVAGPQAGGCHAFGEFMGTSAPSAARDQHPLGQTIRELTPFNEALAVYKASLCG